MNMMLLKRFVCIGLLTVSCAALAAAGGNKDEAAPTADSATGTAAAEAPSADGVLNADDSYVIGMILGDNVLQLGMQLDYDAFLEGFKARVEQKEGRITFDEATQKANGIVTSAVQAKQVRDAAADREFLAANGKKSGVTTLPSGLQYEVVKQGTGEKPQADSTVEINYSLSYPDGQVVESNRDDPTPADIPLGQTIAGFTEGILLMSVGSEFKLYIPPELAYGDRVLVFDIALRGVKATPAPEAAPAQ
jgi:FKBP-type peptidyl-prolyl cis-trans isomerase